MRLPFGFGFRGGGRGGPFALLRRLLGLLRLAGSHGVQVVHRQTQLPASEQTPSVPAPCHIARPAHTTGPPASLQRTALLNRLNLAPLANKPNM